VSATLVDLSEARLQRAVEAMDDETLIWTMLGLQSPTEWGAPMFGGQTEQGATATRTVFMEIAQRWIPLETFAPAFRRHMDDLDVEVTDA